MNQPSHGTEDHKPDDFKPDDFKTSGAIDYRVDLPGERRSAAAESPLWQKLLYFLLGLIILVCLAMIFLQSEQIKDLNRGVVEQQVKIEKLQAVAEELQTIDENLKADLEHVTEKLRADLQIVSEKLQADLQAIDRKLKMVEGVSNNH